MLHELEYLMIIGIPDVSVGLWSQAVCPSCPEELKSVLDFRAHFLTVIYINACLTEFCEDSAGGSGVSQTCNSRINMSNF